jgi:hypothetical protein
MVALSSDPIQQHHIKQGIGFFPQEHFQLHPLLHPHAIDFSSCSGHVGWVTGIGNSCTLINNHSKSSSLEVLQKGIFSTLEEFQEYGLIVEELVSPEGTKLISTDIILFPCIHCEIGLPCLVNQVIGNIKGFCILCIVF